MRSFLSVIALLACVNAFACTDFKLIATDGTVVVARTMEFALDLKSNVRTRVHDHKFVNKLPNGKDGLSWEAKYGYIYLDGLGVDMAVEGMNEKGLSFEALYLPNLAKYQDPMPGKEDITLPYVHIGDWALSNFSSVDEVKQAITGIIVIPIHLKEIKNQILPLHFSFHDSYGKSIVVEYIDGRLNVYDNPIGVMTNSPEFPWHLTNLNNYVNLRPSNPKPIVIDKLTFIATGQGSGMLGLPGDISPPSRFVKMTILSSVAKPAVDSVSAVNLAQHIINNVDIPFGLARESSTENYTSEYTQWTVFKDLSNRIFYYHTYNNQNLHKIDMRQVDFSNNAKPLSMPIDNMEDAVIDFTAKFNKSIRTKS